MHMRIVAITAPLAFIGLMVLMVMGHATPLQPTWYTIAPYFGFGTVLIGFIAFYTLIHGLLYDAWLDYKYGMANR